MDCPECYRLKNRIKELSARKLKFEEGSCRFNCRTQKEVFRAGYKAGVADLCLYPAKTDWPEAYKQWLKEERERVQKG